MLIKRAATLQETLGLKEVPANGIAWHQLLLQGLPYSSLRSAAKTLNWKEPVLAGFVGLKGALLASRKKTRKLSATEADLLYAIAIAYVKLAGFKGTTVAAEWLVSPHDGLKGSTPVELLRTRLGTEYVNTAIERMRPAPTFTKRMEDADDEEEENDFA